MGPCVKEVALIVDVAQSISSTVNGDLLAD